MKNSKLGNIVLLGLAVGMIIPSICYTYLSLNSQQNKMQAELNATHERYLDVLALASAEPFWNFDKQSGEKLAAAFFGGDAVDVVEVRITGVDGKVFVEKQMKAPSDGEVILKSKNVMHEKEKIGTVEIKLSTSKLEKSLQTGLKNIIISTLMELLASILIVYAIIHAKVLRPVKRLVLQAQKLSEHELVTKFAWKSNDEIGTLGTILDNAREELKSLFQTVKEKNLELQEINGNLEKIVEERTRTINMILNHVQSGFLLVDKNLIIQEGFTNSCNKLFQQKLESGQSLFNAMSIDDRSSSLYKLITDQVFEDILPEEMSLAQIPSRIKIKETVLSVTGGAVRDLKNQVKYILLTIVDVTELQKAELEIQKIKAIIRIMKLRDSFRSFVKEFIKGILKCHKAIADSNLRELRRELHTLKGNSSLFGLMEVSDLIHKTEDNVEITEKHIDNVEKTMKNFLEENFSILQIAYSPDIEEILSIEEKKLKHISYLLSDRITTEANQAHIRKLIMKLQCKSAASLVSHLSDYAHNLADRMGKKLTVNIINGDMLILSRSTATIFQALVHVIRNSIGHGIEAPLDRGQKPKNGTINISFTEDIHSWFIKIEDDGRGLDLEQIRKIAIKKEPLRSEEFKKINDAELAKLIFIDGFTTVDSITNLAGRGVGMGAIQVAVEEAEGIITLNNYSGKGLALNITLPKPIEIIS